MSTATMTNELAEQIVLEVSDERYMNRTHGTKSCVNAGCTGPLCLKFNRDRQRMRYEARRQPERMRPGSRTPELDKFLDEFTQLLKNNRSTA